MISFIELSNHSAWYLVTTDAFIVVATCLLFMLPVMPPLPHLVREADPPSLLIVHNADSQCPPRDPKLLLDCLPYTPAMIDNRSSCVPFKTT